MRFGVIPAHGPQHLDVAIEQVRLCEELGIDSIWIEEHHAAGPYWPTPLLALAALAGHTEKLILGTNVLILPLYDPVHVAEQMAVLDLLTNRRMVLAAALGDGAEEMAMFRVPADRRGKAFEEQIQIIRALWRGEPLDFHGEFYEYRGIRLGTPPAEGGPPIWVGGWGPRQLERAARLGDAWFPGPVADLPGVIERLEVYERHVRERGQNPDSRTHPLTRDVVVAQKAEEAWELAERDVLPSYRENYLESQHPLVGQGKGRKLESLRALAKDRILIGDPDAIVEEVLRTIRETRTDHLIFRTKLPGVSAEAITRMIRLLGQEVLPALRKELAS